MCAATKTRKYFIQRLRSNCQNFQLSVHVSTSNNNTNNKKKNTTEVDKQTNLFGQGSSKECFHVVWLKSKSFSGVFYGELVLKETRLNTQFTNRHVKAIFLGEMCPCANNIVYARFEVLKIFCAF